MQALKTLFSRAQAQATVVQPLAPSTQPTELSADSLKLVGGGLPRIGGGSEMPPVVPTELTLPSVS